MNWEFRQKFESNLLFHLKILQCKIKLGLQSPYVLGVDCICQDYGPCKASNLRKINCNHQEYKFMSNFFTPTNLVCMLSSSHLGIL